MHHDTAYKLLFISRLMYDAVCETLVTVTVSPQSPFHRVILSGDFRGIMSNLEQSSMCENEMPPLHVIASLPISVLEDTQVFKLL